MTVDVNNPNNKVATLALFAKAAYAVQDWEINYINDPSAGADEAYTELLENGWRPVDFSIEESTNTFSSSNTKFTATTKMEGGFYTHANAAALVARSDDTLVISFRGTNDANEKGENTLDPNDRFHPDKDHWTTHDFLSSDSMTNHYRYFNQLLDKIEQYRSDNPDIQQVHVTGHSMGGAMAIQYMANQRSDSDLESVIFAAALFTYKRNFLGFVHRRDYRDDERIIQVEISGDPVTDSWDYLIDNNRPGKVIKVHGNKTADTPDSKFIYNFRSDNHSMNYYLELARGIDSTAWQRIVDESVLTKTTDILIGAQQQGKDFIVAEQPDKLSGNTYEFIYGGQSADILIGGSGRNILLGGEGQDTLTGGKMMIR